MSDTFTNETGCEVSRSHMTGDIVCQRPGPDCDCLMSARPANGIHASRSQQLKKGTGKMMEEEYCEGCEEPGKTRADGFVFCDECDRETRDELENTYAGRESRADEEAFYEG